MLLALLLVVVAVPTIFADNSCPKGYVNATVDGKPFCYKVYKQLATHDQAEAQCKTDGATLVKIDGANQNNLIMNVTHNLGTVYIGVQCFRGSCRYDDGRPVTDMSFFYGQTPTIEVGQCVVLENQQGIFYGKWLSVDCGSVSSYVCQYGPSILPYIEALQESGCNSPYPIYGPANISSPGYPNPYLPGLNCAYFLAGGPYRISFDDFQTQYGGNSTDYVTIYTQTNGYTYYSRYNSYYGNLGTTMVNLGYSNILITFSSVGSTNTNLRGFHAKIIPISS